ncbi:MAG: DMT family transporter [Mariprofundus sp.]|nr:DMT family transporter [Mariprofundus sp.]
MKSSPSLAVRTLFFTTIALIAFAANSVLCRLALGDGLIDASGFTIIRLLSGAIVLLIILQFNSAKNSVSSKGSWSASALLFIYAAAFSFAYVSLDTATGALVLFGAVQLTMILLSIMAGNRLHLSEWIGASIAFIGFVFLILPDITTPSLTGFILMLIAGIAWGIYSLKGRASLNPLMDTAYNFFRSMPLIIILAVVTLQEIQLSKEGILLAVLSGGIASGIGYTIWYLALAGLSATQAAVVQLLVPIIAAIGGVIFVLEPITSRLLISGIMILGGIFIVVIGNYYVVVSHQRSK